MVDILESEAARPAVSALLAGARYAFVGLSLLWIVIALRVRRPG